MDFIDNDGYENLNKIIKLNDEMCRLKNIIKDLNDRKRSNICFLNMQQEHFEKNFKKKIDSLKKYNITVIKNIININLLRKKNIELLNLEIQNNKLIDSIDSNLSNFSIEKYNTKKSIEKILIKYNNIIQNNKNQITDSKLNEHNLTNNLKCKIIKNIDNINNYYLFYGYLLQYNLYNINTSHHNQIYKQLILKRKLNIEYKEYLRFKQEQLKNIKKLQIIINKGQLSIFNNTRRLNLLHQKTKNIKNKYLFTQKDIIFHEKRNIKIQNDINKNIEDFNIKIIVKTVEYNTCLDAMNECNIYIESLNDIKGDIVSIDENCAICLDPIKRGIKTICGHYYHYGCINIYIFNIIQKKLKINIICPICRQYI